MAQYPEFYQYHKEKGSKFKALFVDTGYLDKKIGFPISQVDNKYLVELYKLVILAKIAFKRIDKPTKQDQELYASIRSAYYKELPKYHVVRKYL